MKRKGEYEFEINGTVHIRSKIGPTQKRLEFQRGLRPTIKLEGWHASHSQGAIIGAERASGIFYAPPEVNLNLQEHGIERYLAEEVLPQKADSVDLYLTTVTRPHEGTNALHSIEYKLEAQLPGEDPTVIFEASIEVDISKGTKKGQYKVVVKAGPRGELERYLKTIPRRPKVPPRRAKGKRQRVTERSLATDRDARAIVPEGIGDEQRGIAPASKATAKPLSTKQSRMIPGTKGEVFSAGVGVAQGVLAEKAFSADVRARRKDTGFASTADDYANESSPELIARALQGLAGEADFYERFDITRFRLHLKVEAEKTHPGKTFNVTLPIRRRGLRRGERGDYYWFKEVRIVYRRQSRSSKPRAKGGIVDTAIDAGATRLFGRNWKQAVAGEGGQWLNKMKGEWVTEKVKGWPSDAAISYVPDLDVMIDPWRSDQDILDYLGIELPREGVPASSSEA